MSRIFLSHSSKDDREAVALKQWLVEQDPPLATDIFLDLDRRRGIRPGTRWKDALREANARCEAVICLLSSNWEASSECKTEYRTAETLNKRIFCARLEQLTHSDISSEWQRVDLFGNGPKTPIEIVINGVDEVVEFATEGLLRLKDEIVRAGVGPESFAWPPPGDLDRRPYRGWEPHDEVDAGVFFGRDAQLVRGLDSLRRMRASGVETLFVVLGASGAGKSSFLRAGLLPRLRRDDREFVVLDVVRPERNVLTGPTGLAHAIHSTRCRLGLTEPHLADVKAACRTNSRRLRELLREIQDAAARSVLIDEDDGGSLPTLVLPLDQAEELFACDAGDEALQFLQMLDEHARTPTACRLSLIVVVTIRTDHAQSLQSVPELAAVKAVLFDDLKPMPRGQFKEVIVGPARRAADGGRPLRIEPALVDELLADCTDGADTLPLLSLMLARLFDDYGDDGDLTLAEYQAMGGMRNIVQTEVDGLLSRDNQTRREQLKLLRTAFVPWLATFSPGNDQAVRRVARWDDLPPKTQPLLDAFVAKRLLVKDTRASGDVVEVALESLLRQWDELAEWLREQRQNLLNADDIQRDAVRWEAAGRDSAYLLSGTRLTEAEILAKSPEFVNKLATESDFLAASRAAEDQSFAEKEEQRQAEIRAARQRQQEAENHAAELRRSSRKCKEFSR
jgi:TIR domain